MRRKIILLTFVVLANLAHANNSVVTWNNVSPTSSYSAPYNSYSVTGISSGNQASYSNGYSTITSGDYTYGSDGSSSHRVGNQIYNSDGSSSTISGDLMMNSNGTSCLKTGNQVFCH